MAKAHKVHRSKDAWKKDILLLTCILRLRVQPLLPYLEIADLFLQKIAAHIAHLVKKTAPQELWPTLVEKGTKEWLVGYLEDGFKAAEFWESQTWLKAREIDEMVVKEMLRVTGLDERGYVLAAEEETRLQIRWRKEGDWKAGSVPERTPTMMRGVKLSIGGPVFHRMVRKRLAELPEVFGSKKETHSWYQAPTMALESECRFESFAKQLEEVRHAQDFLSRDDKPGIPLTSSGRDTVPRIEVRMPDTEGWSR
jgi:hypothetical protein